MEKHKKKIAFIMDEGIIGGTEIALTQMLQKINTDRYEITLFTNVRGNPCIGQIPECIKIYNLDDLNLRTHFFSALRRGALLRAVQLLHCYIRLRLSKTIFEEIKWSIEPFMLSEEIFDCAIAYRQSWLSVFIILNKIKSKRKAVWIHGNLWGGEKMISETLKNIGKVDKVFCVSVDASKYIENICPEVLGRTEVLYNLLNDNQIIEKAAEGIDFGSEVALVTVGRMTDEKGQIMIPQTVRLLMDAGYQVKWYIVGDGGWRKQIEQQCKTLEVEDNVIFTGALSNPYPYMKGCSIYVQTSYAEGWGLTVQEAKILHKPIVTTDLPVMREQIVHMKNGIITEGISPEALFEGIKTLLDNPALCAQFAEELKKESHDNTQELEKLYAFIES